MADITTEQREARNGIASNLGRYESARVRVGQLRAAKLEVERDNAARETEVTAAVWARIVAHNASADSKTRYTEASAKVEVATSMEQEMAVERRVELDVRRDLEMAEAELSVAREELRFAYAAFALATGHNLMGQNMGAL